MFAARFLEEYTSTVDSLDLSIPRLLQHLAGGKGEVGAQGSDGLRILQAMAWWDSGVVDRELAGRRSRGGHAI